MHLAVSAEYGSVSFSFSRPPSQQAYSQLFGIRPSSSASHGRRAGSVAEASMPIADALRCGT